MNGAGRRPAAESERGADLDADVGELTATVQELVLQLRHLARRDRKLASDLELADLAVTAYRLAQRIEGGAAEPKPTVEPLGEAPDTTALTPLSWVPPDEGAPAAGR